MSSLPLVSVIIPAYNAAEFIGESIQSALAQDYPNMEIIVVDDGSTDDTVAVLSKYRGQIRLLQQDNAGPAVARNRGLRSATGEYIAFLDADDLWLPNKLRTQVAYLEANPDVGIVYSAWRVWHASESGEFETVRVSDDIGGESEIDPRLSGWIYVDLFDECVIHTTTVLIRKTIVERVGDFDARLRRGQDYDYWMRASFITPIHKLKRTLSLYRIHHESITRTPQSKNYGYYVVRNALEQLGRTGPDGRQITAQAIRRKFALLWYRFGYTHYRSGDKNVAAGAFCRCIRHRPLWLSAWGYLARSLIMRGRARTHS